MFISSSLVISLKNLKGVEKDKEKGYKTLMTVFKNGRKIIYFLLELYFISMFAAYFIFDLGNRFLLILLIIFSLKIIIFSYFNNKRDVLSYRLNRLTTLIFIFAFIYDKSSNIYSLVIILSIIFLYLIYLIFTIKWNTTM